MWTITLCVLKVFLAKSHILFEYFSGNYEFSIGKP